MELALILGGMFALAILAYRQTTRLDRQYRAAMERKAALAQEQFERAVKDMGL